MKFLKTAGLLVLALLFMTSCAGFNTTSKRQLHEPEEIRTPGTPAPNFYVKHSCWKSPFNPHEVIQYWVKIGARQLNPIAVMIVAGNPKINWKQDYRGTDPTLVPIPKGEIASAIVFFLVKTPTNTIELVAFVYKDDLGVQNLYILNMETKCYERKLIPKHQQSYADAYLKTVFNLYPTDE